MTMTATDLRSKSRDELDYIFRASPAGTLPTGRSHGTALVLPGTLADRIVGGLIRLLVWRGKMFRSGETGTYLKNLISPLSLELFRAEVYEDDSWFDDRRAIVLDYSKSSFLVRMIRDEIRSVGDGVYLGQVFLGKKRVILFMLEFPSPDPTRPESVEP